MRKKENKPVRSRRAFRRSLILALAAVWLLFAALLTYVTAYHLYKDFSQTAASYADNVSLIGNLDAYYARPELDWYYGQQYAHPDRLIHDMQQIYRALTETDLLVLASPIYYHNISGQLKCAIDRFYSALYPTAPSRLRKVAMFLASGDADMTDGARFSYEGDFLGYLGLEDVGLVSNHDANWPKTLRQMALSL